MKVEYDFITAFILLFLILLGVSIFLHWTSETVVKFINNNSEKGK